MKSLTVTISAHPTAGGQRLHWTVWGTPSGGSYGSLAQGDRFLPDWSSPEDPEELVQVALQAVSEAAYG